MRRGSARWIPAALVLLALVAGCGDDGAPTGTGDGGGGTADRVINIKNGASNLGANAYSPSPDTVRVGKTVAWRNLDSMVHTATAAGTFDTGNIPGGQTSNPIAMSTAGTFDYICKIPGHVMSGRLVVLP